ncbi:hypothetical protein ElyMa_007036600 [Elysia marginata]|uniref:Transposase DDE domain-containing protein n=1 Tax=Elysia marginata TaxID=1093978 RepID=A0AAV4JU38_9GAST|nr:hypothetical protein ElyMa_007036600 [Elysia marginata]
MEFTKKKMQFYIFMRCKLGESAKLIHETLPTVCGDCACPYQSVCRRDRLAGRKFDRIQDLAKAVNSELRTIPEEDHQGVFRK